MIDFTGKRVSLIGCGISNRAVLKYLDGRCAGISIRDKRPPADAETLMEKYACVFGEDYLKDLAADVIVISPSVRPDTPEIEAARKGGAVITGEIALTLSMCRAKVFAVTGSDGKTTTTTIIHKMLSRECEKRGKGRVLVGGNIGTPLINSVSELTEDDFAVFEISSFQLMSLRFSPDVAVITNISPNHLDIHKDMDEYVGAKRSLIAYQTPGQRAVLNYGNGYTRGFADSAPGDVVFFNGGDCIVSDGWIRLFGEPVVEVGSILIPGEHNVQNYEAAIAATSGYVSPETAAEVASSFPGVPHRRQLIAESRGVKYYNSSIDTSPTRTAAALSSFDRPLIAVMGGYDKHIPLEPLIPCIKERTKFVSLTGPTGKKLSEMLSGAGLDGGRFVYNDDFADAVRAAASKAENGDAVILSPAAASFDRFKNFEERGEVFTRLIKELTGNGR